MDLGISFFITEIFFQSKELEKGKRSGNWYWNNIAFICGKIIIHRFKLSLHILWPHWPCIIFVLMVSINMYKKWKCSHNGEHQDDSLLAQCSCRRLPWSPRKKVENSRYRKISMYFMEGRNLKIVLNMFLFKVIFYKYFQHSIAGKQVGNSQINCVP
jgi:hypothetical protein